MPSVFQDLETSSASVDTKTPALVSGLTPGIASGQRHDADSATAAEGEYHPLYTNAVGRLKVSVQPADYSVVTGNITAIQATANTPVANATVFIDVGRVSNLTAYCSGTFAGMNVIFEASTNSTNGTDGLWWGIQAARTNANLVETVSGVLSAQPIYAWEMSVNAYAWVRVRATARTSGTQVWTLTPGAYATEPAPAIQTHAVTGSGTFTVAGTVTANPAAPTTTRTVTAATTNTLAIKAAVGSVYNLSVFNSSASGIFVKLYNQTTAPVLASAIPTLVIPVAAGAFVTYQFGPFGERYATGIALAVTGAVGNTDTTAVAAGINVNTTFI